MLEQFNKMKMKKKFQIVWRNGVGRRDIPSRLTVDGLKFKMICMDNEWAYYARAGCLAFIRRWAYNIVLKIKGGNHGCNNETT